MLIKLDVQADLGLCSTNAKAISMIRLTTKDEFLLIINDQCTPRSGCVSATIFILSTETDMHKKTRPRSDAAECVI